MPRLSDLTDYQIPQPEEVPADIPRVYITKDEAVPSLWDNFGMAGVEDKSGKSEHPLLKQLFGLGGEERYQLWPEKVVREGLTAAGDVMNGATPQWAIDPATGEVHTSPQMVEKAQAISALAGTGGLGGVTDATLGATPFLRPALKYKDRLYKGKEGQSHQDVIPEALYPEFNRMAMSGEDISHYNFGFHNDKGHFLNREDALKYGIDTGLIDPQAGQFGALTSTLMADSSKPGTAIEAMAKTEPFYSALEHNVAKINQSKMTGDQWLGTLSNKPGVKPEELDWTGLKDFLKENGKASVTKEQIEQHLAANKVELKEVSKGTGELKAAAEDLQKAVGSEPIAVKNHHDKLYPDEIEQGLWSGDITIKDLPTNLQPHAEKMLSLRHQQEQPTKYHGYQLPGGENYREMLLTLPEKGLSPELAGKQIFDNFVYRNGGQTWEQLSPLSRQEYIDRAKQTGIKATAENPYRSSHWDEPNILAHVRMNDRTMSEPGYSIKNLKSGNVSQTFPTYDEALAFANKLPENIRNNIQINEGISPKKSLHLEEIQSDWHQQGRERGYKGDTQSLIKVKNDAMKEWKNITDTRINQEGQFYDISGLSKADQARAKEIWNEHGNPFGQRHEKEFETLLAKAKKLTPEENKQTIETILKHKSAFDEANKAIDQQQSGVPNAPFKKSWHELALKRMIREAAEKGYDRLSWTPGEAQVERYSLAKTLDKLSYNPKQKYLKAWDKNGQEVIAKEGVTPENLAEYVGKEGANKLLEQKPQNFERIPSVKKEDLKVTQTEHQYVVTNKDKRAIKIGKGTVSSEAEALEYVEHHLNKTAFEVNNNREIEYGRLGPTHILEGQELKVGGEGMKGFYDKIIPKSLERIGKEHGVKVKTVYKHEGNPTQEHRDFIDKMTNDLHDEFYNDAIKEGFDKDKAKRFADKHTANIEPWHLAKALNKNEELNKVFQDKLDFEKHGKQPIHYINIPQSLKDTALHKGFPLFSSTHMFTPISHDPFEKKK